jgi:DNA-binding Xre family transcriptional regulator
MQTVGMLITSIMSERKINQKQFAALVGMSPSNINRITKNTRTLHMKNVERWVESLGLGRNAKRDLIIAIYLSKAPKEVKAWIKKLESQAKRND